MASGWWIATNPKHAVMNRVATGRFDNLRRIADICAVPENAGRGGDGEMDKTQIPSLIAAIAAILAALIAYWGGLSTKRVEAQLALQRAEADRRAETERTARKFSEPLGRAAYDLQSRIYNIIKSDFLNAYLENGDQRTKSYAIKNTLFVIAQYFAWTELVRREIQFIDLGADERTRKLSELQDSIYTIWQNNAYGDPLFRIFAGEQRAIGERLVRDGAHGPECLGYASFLDFYEQHPDRLLAAVEADVIALGTNLPRALTRLVALQHALVELLNFLDPGFVRFPQRNRSKLEA